MISRRQVVLALGASALVSPIASLAQTKPVPGVHRIGFLALRSRSTAAKPDVWYDAFTQGMRELGYVEGNNLIIEWRFADGKYERLPGLAAELVRMKVDVLVTHTAPGVIALQHETKTVPIVVTGATNPVGQGFTQSLARPTGNVTGLSNIGADLGPKRVELLATLIPKLAKIAFLQNPGSPASSYLLNSATAAAQRMGVKVLLVDARTTEEIERGFALMARERVDAVIVANDGFFVGQGKQIADLAIKNRIPMMSPYKESIRAGSLMSYGQDTIDAYRKVATYVDKILKGAKPGDLPIEQPTKIHFAINRKTAIALGLAIPDALILRADEVIE